MKTFNYTFGFKEIVTSLIINLLIEKDSSRGINSHIRVENWTDGNQTLSDITRGIFINIIRTTENNDIFYWREKRNISSAPKNIFYTLSTNAKIDESVNKSLFQTLLYQVRPATIESPIMMELMFSCLTWKQWFWWILSQLLL